MRQDGEPSVDQLLQSIKKVIARESRPAVPHGGKVAGPDSGEVAGPGSAGGDSGAAAGVSGAKPGGGTAQVRTGFQPPYLPQDRSRDRFRHGSQPNLQAPFPPRMQPQPEPASEPAPDPADEEEAEELRALSDAQDMPADAFGVRAPGAGWADPPASPADQGADEDDLIEEEGDGEAPADEPDVAPPDTPRPAAPAPEARDTGAGAPLLSEETAASVRRSLAALAMVGEPAAPDSPNLPGAATLDATTRELLRPMLAQWLETHLPALVERELRAEIARITGAPAP